MTTEYITRTKLIAGEGMVLTNGTNYGTVIFLAEGESAYDYREITKSEYEAILDEQAKENMPDVVYGGASHTNI
jgi:hypothetical protein